MDNKDKLLKYAIYYLSKYSSSKKNLEFILKKKIRRLSDEKRIRFQLYNEIQVIIDKLEKTLNTIVLSSNQALIWDTLVNINKNNSVKGFGKLFHANK